MTGEEGKRVENQPKEETLREIMVELRKAYGNNIPEPEGLWFFFLKHFDDMIVFLSSKSIKYAVLTEIVEFIN